MDERIAALEDRVATLEQALKQTAQFPKYMTVDQVCEAVQMGRVKFFELRKEGVAPKAIYFGTRSMRFDRDDVLAWAASLKETA